MTVKHKALRFETNGKGTYEITRQVTEAILASGIKEGVVTVFIQHTSCSLCLMENADPSARKDLHAFFDRLVPENAPYFVHTHEGPDDMPSHIRSVLTRSSETIPISQGEMLLGTWQGIYLFEHRKAPHRRNIILSIMGT